MNKRWRRWIVIAVAALIAWMVSHYWLQLAVVIGDSMEPAYHNLQFVLLDKHISSLESGDVIAFRNETTGGYLIKRVIAVPGDSIWIDNGILYVNGEISGLYRDEEIAYAGIAGNEIFLTQNEYFVMGDNHEHSRDSRYEEIGYVYNTEIIGRVLP